MNKPYKIAIIGYPVTKPQEISSCFSMLTYGLTEGFKAIPHVTMTDNNIIKDYNPLTKYFSATLPQYDLDKIEPVDFIICINYCKFFNQPGVVDKLRTKCRKVVSFLECPAMADYCFVFKHTMDKIPLDRQFQLPPVYLPEFTKNERKDPKSILLDHMCLYWLGNKNMEWSERIWKWLEDLSKEYKLYSLVDADVQYGAKGNPQEVQLAKMPKYITPIFCTNYTDYMKKTERIEQFVVMHQGSYNFSVVDMAARGMRVIAPPKFVPEVNEKLFNIKHFTNKEELVKLLTEPIEHTARQMLRCVSIQQVAKIMDGEFQKWLL